MNKFRSIGLLFILSSMILSGCAQERYVWKKSDANQNDYNRDAYECETEAARSYPVSNTTQSFGSGYTAPVNVLCTYGVCTATGGQQINAPTLTADANQSNRENAVKLCMRARGWQLVSVSQQKNQSEKEDAFRKGKVAYNNKDYETALREWRPLAEEGFPVVQNFFGIMYAKGEGVPQDYTTAAMWFRKAAEQGGADAQRNLSLLYKGGNGVPKDRAEEMKWLNKAVEKGNPMAQTTLGLKYATGDGVPQDYTTAAIWLRKAAENGQAPAQHVLGIFYTNGDGVQKDFVQAYMWFNIAKSTQMLDKLAANMTPQQIQEAKVLSDQWISSHQK